MAEENKNLEVNEQEGGRAAAEARRLERRRRNLARITKTIQYNAFNPKTVNGIKKEITEQQAFSIFLRSKQLVKEGLLHPNMSLAEYQRQIEECYRQRKE